MLNTYDYGTPGIRADVTSASREWLYTASGSPSNSPPVYLPGGRVIDGTKTRDTGNSPDLSTIRPGMPFGRITSSSKYANAIIGVSTVAYADNDTTLTTIAATAAEIVRRIGATGTFKLTGPPTAAGTVATVTATYSAINTTTGVITLTDLNAAFIAGSFIRPGDGSETMKGVLDEYLVTTDEAGTSQDTRLSKLCISGFAKSSQLLFWPTDTSLRAWYKAQLNDPSTGPGPFRFDDNF